ncbi:unnamed protein product [Owenia fusiformis]|uniref:Uncharacterized protein n=1 Tax=Owenia fusiformis TaxID=6347 RepID=A0A8J1TXC3_OWEFU|nr:unnamed protein product [Owenia fusiformis]
MATYGGEEDDDFEVDEYGIYRERQKKGIPNLDEFGILRDDGEDALEPQYTHRTADSGLGYEKTSSTSTVRSRQPDKMADIHSEQNDSHPLDEQSLGLSDFDPSFKDEISFDHGSLMSKDETELHFNDTVETHDIFGGHVTKMDQSDLFMDRGSSNASLEQYYGSFAQESHHIPLELEKKNLVGKSQKSLMEFEQLEYEIEQNEDSDHLGEFLKGTVSTSENIESNNQGFNPDEAQEQYDTDNEMEEIYNASKNSRPSEEEDHQLFGQFSEEIHDIPKTKDLSYQDSNHQDLQYEQDLNHQEISLPTSRSELDIDSRASKSEMITDQSFPNSHDITEISSPHNNTIIDLDSQRPCTRNTEQFSEPGEEYASNLVTDSEVEIAFKKEPREMHIFDEIQNDFHGDTLPFDNTLQQNDADLNVYETQESSQSQPKFRPELYEDERSKIPMFANRPPSMSPPRSRPGSVSPTRSRIGSSSPVRAYTEKSQRNTPRSHRESPVSHRESPRSRRESPRSARESPRGSRASQIKSPFIRPDSQNYISTMNPLSDVSEQSPEILTKSQRSHSVTSQQFSSRTSTPKCVDVEVEETLCLSPRISKTGKKSTSQPQSRSHTPKTKQKPRASSVVTISKTDKENDVSSILKPSSSDSTLKYSKSNAQQDFKIKSKSQNVVAKQQPIKAQIGVVPNVDYSTSQESSDQDASLSKHELSVRLKLEHSQHKEDHRTISTLQEEYDNLLSKYALAEVTIDQLKLGAKVNLYSDSPAPGQSSTGKVTPSIHHPHTISMGTKGQGMLGTVSPAMQGVLSSTTGSRRTSAVGSGQADMGSAPIPGASIGQLESSSMVDGGGNNPWLTTTSSGESMKLGLVFKASGLADQVDSFNALITENQLSPEEQNKVYNQLKENFASLQKDYLTTKQEHDLLRRQGVLPSGGSNEEFDADRSLEGELFNLGTQLDDLHEHVENKAIQIANQRTPFQDTALQREENVTPRSGTPLSRKISANGSLLPDRVSTPQTTKSTSSGQNIGIGSVGSVQKDQDVERQVQHLQSEYNSLIDRYRRLKEMPRSSDRDREIQNLVENLHTICAQSPDGATSLKVPAEVLDDINIAEDEYYNEKPDEEEYTSTSPEPRGTRGSGIPRSTRKLKDTKKTKESGNLKDGSKVGDYLGSHSSIPDSGLSTPSGSRPDRYKLRPHGGREGDIDSGFMGSESSRQSLAQHPQKKQPETEPGLRNKRQKNIQHVTKEKDAQPNGKLRQPSKISYPHGGQRQMGHSQGQLNQGDHSQGGHSSEEEAPSFISAGSRSSVKSEQLKALQEELVKLKNQMNQKLQPQHNGDQPQPGQNGTNTPESHPNSYQGREKHHLSAIPRRLQSHHSQRKPELSREGSLYSETGAHSNTFSNVSGNRPNQRNIPKWQGGVGSRGSSQLIGQEDPVGSVSQQGSRYGCYENDDTFRDGSDIFSQRGHIEPNERLSEQLSKDLHVQPRHPRDRDRLYQKTNKDSRTRYRQPEDEGLDDRYFTMTDRPIYNGGQGDIFPDEFERQAPRSTYEENTNYKPTEPYRRHPSDSNNDNPPRLSRHDLGESSQRSYLPSARYENEAGPRYKPRHSEKEAGYEKEAGSRYRPRYNDYVPRNERDDYLRTSRDYQDNRVSFYPPENNNPPSIIRTSHHNRPDVRQRHYDSSPQRNPHNDSRYEPDPPLRQSEVYGDSFVGASPYAPRAQSTRPVHSVPYPLPDVPQATPMAHQQTPTVPANYSPIVPQTPIAMHHSTPTMHQNTPAVPQAIPVVPQSVPTVLHSTPIVPNTTPIVPNHILTTPIVPTAPQASYQVPIAHIPTPMAQLPTPGLPQTTLNISTSVCPVCSGSGQCTHAAYTQTQPSVPSGDPAPLAQPGVTSTPTHVIHSAPNHDISRIAHIATPRTGKLTPRGSKVRYYVREIHDSSSGHDTEEVHYTLHRRNRSSTPRKSSRSKSRRSLYDESVNDQEFDEMDDSLDMANRTARQLKHISDKMRSSMKHELIQSHRDSLLIM